MLTIKFVFAHSASYVINLCYLKIFAEGLSSLENCKQSPIKSLHSSLSQYGISGLLPAAISITI